MAGKISIEGSKILSNDLPRVGSVPSSLGLKIARKYAKGEEITLRQAVLANCAMCCGWYADGKTDCGSKICPLYPWMPYRPDRKKYTTPENKQNPKGEENGKEISGTAQA